MEGQTQRVKFRTSRNNVRRTEATSPPPNPTQTRPFFLRIVALATLVHDGARSIARHPRIARRRRPLHRRRRHVLQIYLQRLRRGVAASGHRRERR